MHYPPITKENKESSFMEILKKYNVEKCFYGHLHGKESFKMGLKGVRNGIEYTLASCDYTNFNLIKIMD